MVDIESTPYQADDFVLDDGFIIDERGKKVSRAPVLNRIRFRFKEGAIDSDKELRLESNSRIVRWEDGSLSLMIGRECVDLSEEPIEGQRMLLGLYNHDLKTIQACSDIILHIQCSCSASGPGCFVSLDQKHWSHLRSTHAINPCNDIGVRAGAATPEIPTFAKAPST